MLCIKDIEFKIKLYKKTQYVKKDEHSFELKQQEINTLEILKFSKRLE
jgi:hypothetical protein